MEIQKEKIAHEKHLLSQGVDFKYLPNIQYNELENVYELIEWCEEYSEALNEINSSWCTWQAAKAQAVPDGFVVVPKEPSADLVNHGHQVFLGHFNEGGQTGGRSLYFAYKAMIEAQEPANDL